MQKLTELELNSLDNKSLVARMDEILQSPYWHRERGGDFPLARNVKNIFNTVRVRGFEPKFQRAVVYKAFGFLLQLLYTNLSISTQFFRLQEKDGPAAEQIYFAARKQWTCISSRIVFEYFMNLTYMIGTGKEMEPQDKSYTKRYKRWLKEKSNPYTYFAITAARAFVYDKEKRSPEIHAGTKLSK